MGKQTCDFYDQLIDQSREIRKKGSASAEVLEALEPIFCAQRRAAKSFRVDSRSMEGYSDRASRGIPLLDAEGITIDGRLYTKTLREICGVVRRKKEALLPPDFENALEGIEYHACVKGVMEDELLLEEMSHEVNVDHDLLSFLVRQVLSPFIMSYAEHVREHIDVRNWQKAFCPVCGREPLMAKIEGEIGGKWLSCSLCFTEWRFKRIACPFCENEDQEFLRYFAAEDDEAHRVDVCDHCKKYIKTVDGRKPYSIRNMLVEHLTTLALDLVAEGEGYQRGSSEACFSGTARQVTN